MSPLRATVLRHPELVGAGNGALEGPHSPPYVSNLSFLE